MLRLLRQQKVRDALAGLALLIATAGLVAAPGEAIAGAKDGLVLCFNVIVPSLFPFFVLSSLVVDLGLAAYLGRALEGLMRPLFRVSGSCAAAVALGFIGGYPVGARTALQLYQQGLCSKPEAERLLAFCNNSFKPGTSWAAKASTLFPGCARTSSAHTVPRNPAIRLCFMISLLLCFPIIFLTTAPIEKFS